MPILTHLLTPGHHFKLGVNMECNILGNGPSRVLFKPNENINIGCVFPWVKCDYLISFDCDVVMKYITTPDCVHAGTKYILHYQAFTLLYNEIQTTPHLVDNIHDVYFNVPRVNIISHRPIKGIYIPGYKLGISSSGHYAAEWAILQGYTKLHLYGMDAYTNDVDSTHSWAHLPNLPHSIPSRSMVGDDPEFILHRKMRWKNAWKHLMLKYKHIEFNFVR